MCIPVENFELNEAKFHVYPCKTSRYHLVKTFYMALKLSVSFLEGKSNGDTKTNIKIGMNLLLMLS
jgi:hypothetical protein